MTISHKHRCIFVHIPKTAGRSVQAALRIPDDREHLSERISDEDRDRYGLDPRLLWWKHLPGTDLRRIVPQETFEDYFKFCIVRNPWDRLVSYFTKHVADSMSFDEWIRSRSFTFEKTASGSIEGLRPQTDYVYEGGKRIVDFVGRFERLAEDWTTVSQRLGIRRRLRAFNVGRHAHYSSYYTPETRELVADAFQSDISAFGYEFGEAPGAIERGRLWGRRTCAAIEERLAGAAWSLKQQVLRGIGGLGRKAD